MPIGPAGGGGPVYEIRRCIIRRLPLVSGAGVQEGTCPDAWRSGRPLMSAWLRCAMPSRCTWTYCASEGKRCRSLESSKLSPSPLRPKQQPGLSCRLPAYDLDGEQQVGSGVEEVDAHGGDVGASM